MPGISYITLSIILYLLPWVNYLPNLPASYTPTSGMGFFPPCFYCCFESPESTSKEHTNSAVVPSQNDLIASDSISGLLLIISNGQVKSIVLESESYWACCTTGRWDAEWAVREISTSLKIKLNHMKIVRKTVCTLCSPSSQSNIRKKKGTHFMRKGPCSLIGTEGNRLLSLTYYCTYCMW